MEQLANLRGCEAHCSVMMEPTDEAMLRRLGVNVTYDPVYAEKGHLSGVTISLNSLLCFRKSLDRIAIDEPCIVF